MKIQLTTQNFKNYEKTAFSSNVVENKAENTKIGTNNTMITLSLAGLAAAGAAIVGIKKTGTLDFEKALLKNGVEIKEGIAVLKDSGEQFTGEIKRFVTRNKKETVKYVDGVITEKIYHNALGKELDGYFYKDGILAFKVGTHIGRQKKSFSILEYKDGNISQRGDVVNLKEKSVFEWARKQIETKRECPV